MVTLLEYNVEKSFCSYKIVNFKSFLEKVKNRNTAFFLRHKILNVWDPGFYIPPPPPS